MQPAQQTVTKISHSLQKFRIVIVFDTRFVQVAQLQARGGLNSALLRDYAKILSF